MTTLSRARPHTATTDRVDRWQPKTDDTPAHRPTPQRIADAVIASYIHAISRHSGRSVQAPKNHLPRPFTRPL
jgi:hypothetical protein